MKIKSSYITLTAAILGLATCFSFFTGCGADESKQEFRIAFVTNQIADFWNIAKAGCRDGAKDFGVSVEVKMPTERSATLQKQIVEDLISSGIQAIAISPLDADNQTQWLNSVAAKLPLITHDSDAPQSNRVSYVGMDNYKAGRMCGELVKKALPDGGGVMLFIGGMGQDNSKHRRQGVIDELFDRERPEKLDTKNYDLDLEKVLDSGKYQIIRTILADDQNAKDKAADAINAYPEMNAMVGLFEYNPPGCYQALKQADKLGQIKLIGFDENDVTLQGIKDGFITGTIVQDPYQYGYQSVKILKELLQGKKPESFIDIAPRKIVKENVDEYWADLKAKKAG
ncbi:MAG: sugar ABC transporter substrate-binding protein [Opitutae bacterium]|nr:sugar ABC transporter substrate-binding protein [Opitutae bacterium]|tara:strand:- start:581 stop:1603 length:1023 start_codon:yes stop_codon:yes gene_type:complete